MIIHCPSCRCEIKTKTNLIVVDKCFEMLTSNFDNGIPLQVLFTCIRCDSKFIIVEWKEKK